MWFDTKKVRACSSLLSKDGELAIKDACDEIDSLRAQVKTMEGELEETKKSCTWNDREAMTVKLAESQAHVGSVVPNSALLRSEWCRRMTRQEKRCRTPTGDALGSVQRQCVVADC